MAIFLFISAFLYSISFVIPFFRFTIFLFTLPLHNFRFKFTDGFLWGVFAFSIHMGGIFYASIRMQSVPWWLYVISTIGIILYLALHTGLWFAMVQRTRLLCSKNLHTLIVIPLINTAFFWYLSYECLWPFYSFEGYPFANPLLCLLNSNSVAICIRHTGFLNSLFIFFFLTALPVLIKKRSFVVLYTIIVIGCVSIPLNIKDTQPHFISLILPLSTQFSFSKNSSFPFEYIKNQALSYPHKKIIIFPESAFYCYALFNQKTLKILDIPGVNYILGSFYQDSQGIYNTIYHIYQGAVQNMHHKQHTVIFTESFPAWLYKIPGTSQWYKENFFIKKAPANHNVWRIEDIVIEPYTCSELFCHCNPLHPLQKDSTLLLCCNDSWFTGWTKYASDLMVADAQFKALLWNKDILYIGYHNALFISSQGTISEIQV